MKVTVDRSTCMGLGLCEVTVPTVFAIDDDGHLVILNDRVDPEQLDRVKTAVAGCPNKALTLTES